MDTKPSRNAFADASLSEVPIRIAGIKISDNASTRYVTDFNQVARSPEPQAFSKVSDMDRFSRSLGWEENAPKREFFIKGDDTDYIIPPEYRQFLPEIEQAITQYTRLHGGQGSCVMGVHQAVIQPNETDRRPFIDAHKDVTMKYIKNGGAYPEAYIVAVSDALGTGFSDYELTDADIEALKNSDDPDQTMSDILNDPSVEYKSLPAGTMVGFDATAAHALANPEVPTPRTVILVTFFPPGEDITPERVNNPHLAQEIEKIKSSDGPSADGKGDIHRHITSEL